MQIKILREQVIHSEHSLYGPTGTELQNCISEESAYPEHEKGAKEILSDRSPHGSVDTPTIHARSYTPANCTPGAHYSNRCGFGTSSSGYKASNNSVSKSCAMVKQHKIIPYITRSTTTSCYDPHNMVSSSSESSFIDPSPLSCLPSMEDLVTFNPNLNNSKISNNIEMTMSNAHIYGDNVLGISNASATMNESTVVRPDTKELQEHSPMRDLTHELFEMLKSWVYSYCCGDRAENREREISLVREGAYFWKVLCKILCPHNWNIGHIRALALLNDSNTRHFLVIRLISEYLVTSFWVPQTAFVGFDKDTDAQYTEISRDMDRFRMYIV